MNFIEQIAAYVIKYAPQYGIKVHSPIIAQAILESAHGTSDKVQLGQNYFGLKWREGRCAISNEYFEAETKEQNPDASYKTIISKFCKFKNMEESVIGYFQWTNISAYANLKGVIDPRKYLEEIKKANYATSLTYVEDVMAVIEKYDLTKYDSMEEKGMENTKLRINIHAGHNPDGKVACGAIGFIKESTENRNVAKEVIRMLRAMGHEVYDCTVDNGTSSSNVLTNIVKKCNAHEVDLDVSIHFNAVEGNLPEDGKTTGTEAIVYNANSKAKDAAERVCKAICELGFRNRGVKYSQSLYVLRKTNAPAMLIECCFVDDKDDVALYDYKAMAEAIVYGITGQRYSEPTNNEEDTEASGTGAETATGDENCLYRVQVGAYSVKTNAEKMYEKLKAAGYDAVIVKA